MLPFAVLLLCMAAILGALFGMQPLGAVIFSLNPPFLNTLQAGIQRNIGAWVWDDALLPLLERPSWLIPAAIGTFFLAVGLWLRRGG